jgi:3-oxoacyl-[acyl-carrier protein] reductase
VFDLSGKTALVTGGGQGMGAGIAAVLARRGATVAVNDLHEERAYATVESIATQGGNALAAPFDVTSMQEVEAGVDAVGSVDILVNNAGVPDGMALTRFQDMDPSEWDRFLDLNIRGVLHCTRAVIDGMCQQKWGRVITVSSIAGQTGLPIGVSLYGAAKGGALAFMRHLALEVASQGVTANSLALGVMNNAGSETEVAAIAAMVPVGRVGTPEDVGAAVVYLASEEASWMTGQCIGLNGGSGTS